MAYLGASAEPGMKMRVSVPLAEGNRVSVNYAHSWEGWQSHLHNHPVSLNALGHLLGNPGEESAHAADVNERYQGARYSCAIRWKRKVGGTHSRGNCAWFFKCAFC